ncbi:MAG: ABC transporter ATP-binding protein [Gammaproteobacteria bacterium]|jgi:putative ABC transport system ATP-binding protein|nr:ABC transporter ATP-binding protein [Gammaproteobacteria bacterium]MBT6114025.1 ABC transporter ATP-binding protein [Candidatus Neomarinimicrobiota bacterium]MBT3722662.1 ABC transporter ATP-binding protein [Gammaproteobacteria bacterium]MBT4075486.1 ABC transporter ATP-binding protein [Gammaproteobacteria bacterium]MBT4193018.1 ABC transporter ATP-binding protein [Gammaproteobacteria bacterium]
MDDCIVVSNLSKTVQAPEGPLTILQDIELKVKPGEALVITGESGSGKTTLLGLMAGLDIATQGEVNLLGENLSDKNEEQRAAIRKGQVGFVFQSFHLVTGATALQNVMLPLELSGKQNALKLAEQVLTRVGLDHRLNTPVEHLSGGEQQRVAIARAYAVEPAILFADEPTGNLDTRTGLQISELLFDLRDQAGTTLILVTHEERLTERADRQVKMSQGCITESLNL